MVCSQDGPMFGLLLSSVFSGHIPPGHRLPTGSSALVGQEVTSHALVGMPISMVRGRGTGYPLRPAPRRVDNLRTEWLSIYLFLVVGLPCSRAGESQGCGNPETPRWTRPDTPARPTGFAIAPKWRPATRGGSGTGSGQGCRFKRKGRGRRQRKKESSSKGLRENKHRNINKTTHQHRTHTTSSLLVNL